MTHSSSHPGHNGWLAHIEQDGIPSRSLAVWIGRDNSPTEVVYYTALTTEGGTLETGEPYARGPALRIQRDVARALYDALAAHFGHAHDSRTLRADYDAERKRSDKLTDALIEVTRHSAAPAVLNLGPSALEVVNHLRRQSERGVRG